MGLLPILPFGVCRHFCNFASLWDWVHYCPLGLLTLRKQSNTTMTKLPFWRRGEGGGKSVPPISESPPWKKLRLGDSKPDTHMPLRIDTDRTRSGPRYNPRVEAISPALPFESIRDESPLRSTAEDLLMNIARIDREIAKLKKKKIELVEAATQPQNANPDTHMSLGIFTYPLENQQPLVEARSPMMLNDSSFVQGDLINKIAGIDGELARTECQLAKLKKKEKELEEAVSEFQTDTDSSNFAVNSIEFLAQKIYAENREIASLTYLRALQSLGRSMEAMKQESVDGSMYGQLPELKYCYCYTCYVTGQSPNCPFKLLISFVS